MNTSLRAVFLACLLMGLAAGVRAQSAIKHPAPDTVQIASSAQLVLDATVHSNDVELHIVRARDHTPITGAGNVTATLDGHALTLEARQDGFTFSTNHLSSGKHSLEVVAAHDGIRELLTGTLMLPSRPDMFATLEKHSSWAWWVLNIAVALLAARLIMRRKKSP